VAAEIALVDVVVGGERQQMRRDHASKSDHRWSFPSSGHQRQQAPAGL